MIIQFPYQSRPATTPSNDNRVRKQAAVSSIFTPHRTLDGTARYSKSSYCAKLLVPSKVSGSPDLWDGGDAA